MIISAISNYRFSSPFKVQNNNGNNSYTSEPLKMAAPLSKDTVSFGATASKAIVKHGVGSSMLVASKASAIAEELQPQFQTYLKKLFAPLIVSPNNPNNIIAEITGRYKSRESIKEKSESNELVSLQDVLDYCTDLNGCKIVLRDGSKEAVEVVLGILLGAVAQGGLIPVEIDSKRPIAAANLPAKENDKYDYANSKFLEKFAKISAKETKRELFINPNEETKLDTRELIHSNMLHFIPYNYHKTNYPALHMLLKFPGQKRVFELQIVGLDVSTYKDLDDKLYKILNNKDVPAEFEELKEAVMPYNITNEKEAIKPFDESNAKIKDLEKENHNINRKINALNKKQKLTASEKNKLSSLKSKLKQNNKQIEHEKSFCEQNADLIKSLEEKIEKGIAFNTYRAQVFLAQREKEPKPYDKKRRSYFPTQERSDIPDMNELYDIYLKCNKKYKARKAKEAKEKAAAQAEAQAKKTKKA